MPSFLFLLFILLHIIQLTPLLLFFLSQSAKVTALELEWKPALAEIKKNSVSNATMPSLFFSVYVFLRSTVQG